MAVLVLVLAPDFILVVTRLLTTLLLRLLCLLLPLLRLLLLLASPVDAVEGVHDSLQRSLLTDAQRLYHLGHALGGMRWVHAHGIVRARARVCVCK